VRVDVYNQIGKKVSQMELSEKVFGVPFNESVVHQALLMQLANRRLGTADTKTRGEVEKSTKKLYAQKHTGRARRGSAKTPLLKGGGVAFGPHPRSYRQSMPKKMRRLALRSILSVKAGNGELLVIDKFAIEKPKTKEIFDMLVALEVDTSAIIVTRGVESGVFKSARNIAGLKLLPCTTLNIPDLLSYSKLIITSDAIQKIEELWGDKKAKEAVNT
jgi:large subunit ribosomal protein L4